MSNKLIKCKTCSADIAKSAKVCPQCGAKNKKPFYAKFGFWLFAAIVAVITIIAVNSNSGPKSGVQTATTNKGSTFDLITLTSMSKADVVKTLGKPIVINDSETDYSYMYDIGLSITGNPKGATLVTYSTANAQKKTVAVYSLSGVKPGDSFNETVKKAGKVKTITKPDGERMAVFTSKEYYSCAYIAPKDADGIIGFMISTDGALDDTIQ